MLPVLEKPKSRLAILSRNFARTAGGAEAYAVNLAQALSQQYAITVFAQCFGPPIASVQFQQVPNGQWLPRWINQLWYSLAVAWMTRGFELVHSHENTTAGNFQTIHVMTVHASLKARAIGKGWLTTQLKLYLSPRLWAYVGLEKARILGANTTVIFASQALLDETTAAMGKIAHTAVAPPGVHLADATPAAALQTSGKQLWALLFVANDFQKKGLEALLQALHILKNRNLKVQLKIAGKPSMQARFSAIAEKLGIASQIHFLGSVDDMAAEYRAADLLVHPTTQDVFPMAVLEAMGNHLPVVTSAAPYNSMAGLLTHAENAMLVRDPHDATELAGHIQTCMQSAQVRQTLARGGYAFAKAYDWNTLAKQHHRLYQAALHAGKTDAVE